MRSRTALLAAGLTAFGAFSPAAAQAPAAAKPAQAADVSKSSVSAVFTQTMVPAEGQFKKFTIAVDFDPANPAQTSVQVDVDTASFDVGDPGYNTEFHKPEWFNPAKFPKATFVSSSAKALAPGKLEVAGKFTLKGKTADLKFPVAYRQEGANTVFEGTIPIKRLAFGIGEGEWKDTSILDDEVKVKFKVTLPSRK